VSQLCQHYKLSQKTGKLLWHIDRGCFGGSNPITPVYSNGRDYATDPTLREPIIIDSKKGKILGQYDAALLPPAIVDNPGIDPVLIVPDSTDTKVNAIDANTGAVLWTYNAPGVVGLPVMVINNVAVVGELDGTLALLDVDSGSLLWSTNVGAAIGDIYSDGHPLVGFGAGEGRLVVPAATTLSAYIPE
jgi:outer membrane protein assembly factor BamB